MEPRRGALTAGEKVQFTDRKGKKITDQLVAGGSTQPEHGLILHDDVIGRIEGASSSPYTPNERRRSIRSTPRKTRTSRGNRRAPSAAGSMR